MLRGTSSLDLTNPQFAPKEIAPARKALDAWTADTQRPPVPKP